MGEPEKTDDDDAATVVAKERAKYEKRITNVVPLNPWGKVPDKAEVSSETLAGLKMCDELLARPNLSKAAKEKVTAIRERLDATKEATEDDCKFLKELWFRGKKPIVEIDLSDVKIDLPSKVVKPTTITPVNQFTLLERGFNVPAYEKTLAAMKSLGLIFSHDKLRDRFYVSDDPKNIEWNIGGDSFDNAVRSCGQR
jgi:hypothetical protein